MLHAVIMAGGSGTRFWPESRAGRPKQLLPLAGDDTMIQATVRRLGALVPPERILIVTGKHLAEPIAEQLPEVPRDSIVGEPCRRDTAPAIGLAAVLISKSDPEGIMAVMPADHVIQPDEKFQGALNSAAELLADRPNTIVTFGISPTYAAESFGYIHRGEPATGGNVPPGTYQVVDFKEKPDPQTAQKYLDSGSYYWNSGIFVWRAGLILDALQKHQPQMYEHLQAIAAAHGSSDYEQVLEREFTAIEPISVDYAVMEHYRDVLVMESPFDWDDVGSWQSLERLRETDEHGNTVIGRHLGVDTQGCIVRTSGDHLIATLGVEDCIVVHTPDATLVANKHHEEAVRQLVKLLKEKGWEEYL